LFAGTVYFMIARNPGVKVTHEGIFLLPRPVDVILRRPHFIPFEDLEALYEGAEQIPIALKRTAAENTFVLADSGWKQVGPADILLSRKSGRPCLLRGTILSDRARFIEVVSREVHSSSLD